ncbi:ShKT domain-containing protein [Caenorhabditis elegans]|uniref:ShKT domain-containing protein n=2 Tax=Caenorhabditis elegans TaxID=6239 RepID=O44667_CAEEL|nr:ShKT domain-containing protein [Caenorhabditis elegans]CCD64469.1 ShKT domain-containing protein [Caenorhabditis elegans]|eukprot:NP_503238.2 Uncharacterized protein CELE_C14C6.5 [Caenorhabditis elegans]
MYSHGIAAFLLVLVSQASAEIKLGCKSDPMPDANGKCPPGTTMITAGGCCPDNDVYIISDTTTTMAPTTPSPGSCCDKINPKTGVSDCPGMKNYCNYGPYIDIMKDQCPKTCGYCGSGSATTPGICRDKLNPTTGVSDCPARRNLCNNGIYHDVMKDQCPKTCGYCK